jgi:hypothetical protein
MVTFIISIPLRPALERPIIKAPNKINIQLVIEKAERKFIIAYELAAKIIQQDLLNELIIVVQIIFILLG